MCCQILFYTSNFSRKIKRTFTGIVNVHNFDDKIGLKSCEGRDENKFGFIAERLEVCSAVKRMSAVFRSILKAFNEKHTEMTAIPPTKL